MSFGRGAFGALLLSTLQGACAPEPPPPEPTLRFVSEESHESFGHFLFGPLPPSLVRAEAMEDLGAQFDVFVGEPTFRGESCDPEPQVANSEASPASQHPPLIGEVLQRDDALEYVPRFPMSGERIYTACIDLRGTPAGDLTKSTAATLRYVARSPVRQRSTSSHAEVANVWPIAGRIPANLLRIYVEFDRPMESRQIAGQVALLRNGEPIEDAFVAIPEGLWGPEAKRLTLFLHPGRIKRGVGPRRNQGPVLAAGDLVTLSLGAGLRSTGGASLKEDYEVDYLVTEEDRDLPTPKSWQVEPPSKATGPVRIVFDEPLDVGILGRFAEIRNDRGQLVPGHQSPGPDGLVWSFTPKNRWPAGGYQILATSQIEDLAGNTPLRAFDRETGKSRLPERAPSEFDPSGENLTFEFRVD